MIDAANPATGEALATVAVSTPAEVDEALALTNARREGLSAHLFTNDYRRHQRAIAELEVGTIFINKGICGYIQGYHNGHKLSGLAGEDSVFGIENYLQSKTIDLSYA